MSRKNVFTQSKKKKALALLQSNRLAEARTLYAQICALDRMDAEAWFFLGAVNGQLNHGGAAVECFRRVIALSSGHALAHFNLGMALRLQGKLEEAVQSLREAARLAPQREEIYAGLAHTYVEMDQPEGAAGCYRELLRLKPGDADTCFNLGMMLYRQGRLEEAVVQYRESLRFNPNVASVYDNLGSASFEQGKLEEALGYHRRALELKPDDDRIHSNILMTLLYLPDADPGLAFAEYRKWGETYGAAAYPSHAGHRDPKRRLRVGYVSPDFRNHAVAYFFEPLLANHDPDTVETFCYSNTTRADAVTERLRGLADQWREIGALSDEEAERLIRADEVDILVDLVGHTDANRLKLLARKPAPVQMTWLGYPATTGLSAIDYRLTDELADPAGQEVFFAEKLLRPPGCFLCYKPLPDAPEVAPLPALEKGYVTFGSFNNLAKVNPEVIALWAELLAVIPGSRMLIKSSSLDDMPTRERYYALFEARGVARERLDLLGHTPTQAEHLDLYRRLDIALDTFPYNGTTTTCEALWMGVPVITLAGVSHAGRVGVSLLGSAGFPGWIAETPGQYISLAAALAGDVEMLAGLRASLRECMAASPLCDGKSFALKVEAAYREMWRKYCAAASI